METGKRQECTKSLKLIAFGPGIEDPYSQGWENGVLLLTFGREKRKNRKLSYWLKILIIFSTVLVGISFLQPAVNTRSSS